MTLALIDIPDNKSQFVLAEFVEYINCITARLLHIYFHSLESRLRSVFDNLCPHSSRRSFNICHISTITTRDHFTVLDSFTSSYIFVRCGDISSSYNPLPDIFSSVFEFKTLESPTNFWFLSVSVYLTQYQPFRIVTESYALHECLNSVY